MLPAPILLAPSDPDPTRPADYSIPGLRIQMYDFAAQWLLVVRATEKQEGWVVYHEDSHSHKGTQLATTVRYKKELYCIGDAQETPSGWVYGLMYWPLDEVIARMVELTPEGMARDREEREELRRQTRHSTSSIFYEFVFGFLPARVQNRMAERIFFSPADASRKSGLVQFLIFFVVTAISLTGAVAEMYNYSGKADELLIRSFVLFLLVEVQGGVRWAHAASADRPLGFIPMEILDRLLHHHERRTTAGGV